MNPEAPVFRPATSKPRGVCKYYNTARGCFAGDKCRFLHGETETITPYDRSKTCVYYAAGYCRRGDRCWFRHVLPEKAKAPAESSSSTTVDEVVSEDFDDVCSICYEKPTTYGLLVGCSHVFCIKCIREWRDASHKSSETVSSGVIKKCPYCRVEACFIAPSSLYYPEGHPGKERTIQKYKESMARVPCRYFGKSPPNDRFCPFGRDCFYQHQNEDGTPYVFDKGLRHYLPIHKRRLDRESSMSGLFRSADTWEEISATIQAISDSIPHLIWQAGNSDDGSDDDDEQESEERDRERVDVETLERLATRVLASLTAMENLAQAARDGLEDDEQARVIEEVRDIRARFPPRNDYGEPSDSEPNTATRSTFEPAQLGSSDSEDHHPSRFPSFSSNVIELDDEHSYFDPEETGGYEDEDDDGGPAHECSDNSEGADTMSSVLDVDERPDGNAMSALADRAASLELSGATSPPFVLAYLPEPRTEQHPSSSSNPQAEASFPAGSSVTATVPAAILPFGQAPGEAPLRPEIQFNAKPPFVSDGRGRVVWSNSTRGRSRRD